MGAVDLRASSAGPLTHHIQRLKDSLLAKVFLTASLLAAAVTTPVHAQPTKPQVVLVHGAFEDGSSWASVAKVLRTDHYTVLIAANPLRSVETDSASLAGLLGRLHGPVVLVGHSYGGVLISNAGLSGGVTKALVFVAAMAPDLGESIGELAARFPGSTLIDAIEPAPLSDGGVDLYIRSDRYRGALAADVSDQTAKTMSDSQRPVAQATLQGRSGTPAWRTLPSWFVYGDADQSMPLALHEFLAHRAGAREITVVKGASHDLMLTQANKVAAVIERAANAPMAP